MKNFFLKSCNKCMLPETYETFDFDDKGVCNVCNNYNIKLEKIDWNKRMKKFKELTNEFKNKYEYDCIVPFSGGKDSTFVLYEIVKTHKLKPLVVTFDHGFFRKKHLENNERTLKILGVDQIIFKPDMKIVGMLMLESLIRKGDFCWHCHTGIFSYPIRAALQHKVPLIFWGETQSEITAYYQFEDQEIEFEDEKKFNMMRTLGITADDMYEMIKNKDEIDKRDLIPYTFPDANKLKEINYHSAALGNYIPWDYKKNTEQIIKELGWKVDEVEGVPKDINIYGEKTECFMQGTRDYIKYLKRGYGRVTQINAFNLRKGEKKIDQSDMENQLHDGKKPHSLKIFLEYMGMTEEEFNQTVSKMIIPPTKSEFNKNEFSKKLNDFEEWYREDNSKK